MQPYNAVPRADFARHQIEGLITTNVLTVRSGLHVVNDDGEMVENISGDFVGGKVSHDNYGTVPGQCRLELQKELDWGKVRVRPFLRLSDGVITADFHLGVYILTSPDTPRGESPETYEVTGYDLTYLLDSTGPGDTYVVTAGTTYLAAVRAVLNAAGVDTVLAIDGTRQTTTLPHTMVWALNPSHEVTWLEIVNDLLREINYVGIWADWRGRFRSHPYQTPEQRTIEWTFDTRAVGTNIIGEDRKMLGDAFGVPNWWRFIRRRMDTAPVEGDGIYTVENVGTGPTSQNAVGRVIRRREFIDAADQASLVEQGDAIVAEDQRNYRTFELMVEVMPLAGHMDVVRLVDAGRTDICMVRSWEQDLLGGQGKWVLEAVS